MLIEPGTANESILQPAWAPIYAELLMQKVLFTAKGIKRGVERAYIMRVAYSTAREKRRIHDARNEINKWLGYIKFDG